MALIRKSDVKMHFSSRRDKGLHWVQQGDRPAITTSPVANAAIETNGSVFEDDFSIEHFSPGGTVSAVVMATDSDDTQMLKKDNTPRS
jgi:hypothetical protein